MNRAKTAVAPLLASTLGIKNQCRLKPTANHATRNMKILRSVDSGQKKKDITADFGLAPSTISTILSARKKTEICHANNTVKTDRKSPDPDREEALFSWFKDVTARNLAVSAPHCFLFQKAFGAEKQPKEQQPEARCGHCSLHPLGIRFRRHSMRHATHLLLTPLLLWIAVRQRATLLAWKRQKYSCKGKRVAQVTDDRSGKIATRGAIVPERVDSESDAPVSCLNTGLYQAKNLATKVEILRALKDGVSRQQVKENYDVKRSTLATYVKIEAEILQAFEREKFNAKESESNASKLWSKVTEELAVDTLVEFEDYEQCNDTTWMSAELTTNDDLNNVREEENCSVEDTQNDEGAEAVFPDGQEESISASDVPECQRQIGQIPW
ncbi:hypothetical protein HPB47_027128 [Ixodes persulcatus]|uniref:Uncharacterized protein n=1 Tax=Ixodes persulcatus TaxID=34615 RepID=A0AC60PXB5_IXOPE|nr:hypothetical protein HPB47_027128 [Ixodes persulcatus]